MRAVIVAAVIFLPAVASAGPPQQSVHDHGATPAAPVKRLVPIINGAVKPELISDELAYRHFILAVLPAKQSVVIRRSDPLERVGLETFDAQAFGRAIDGVRERLADIASQRKKVTAANIRTTAGRTLADDLQRREEQILDDTRLRIIDSLSADGLDKVTRHLREVVKPRIVIYGER